MTQDARKQMAVIMGLAVVTLAVFWPVTGYDFINYDDQGYFQDNPHVQAGWTWNGMIWAFHTCHADNWHPLTWLSLMLDTTLHGAGAGGPHFTNVLLHVANSVVLFLLFQRLTGALWRSALVGGLFALHPLHVESVAWVAERKDVLSTLFGLLTLWAYGQHAKLQMGRGRWFALALIFFALGLMSKPMLVTLPFVMLLLDYWPLRRFALQDLRFIGAGLLREKTPFLLMSVVSCAVTLVVQRQAMQSLTGYPLSARAANAGVSYARYLGKTFWPVDLALPYPHPGQWPLMLVMFASLLVAGLCVAALWLGHRRPYVPVGWFWFLGMLIPVIGFVQVGDQSMADRYTYVPLIGIFVIVGWGLSEMLSVWRIPKKIMMAAAVLGLAACAIRTRDQLQYWQNSESLFRHTIAVTENNDLAYNNLGTALARRGEIDEALVDLREAIRIRPDYADAHNNLGIILVTRGAFEEAVEHFQEALRSRPDYADAHMNLGVALVSQGKLDAAIRQYFEVLRLSPDDVEAHCNLGIALQRSGRRAEALAQFKEAFRLRPENVVVRQKMIELGGQNLETRPTSE